MIQELSAKACHDLREADPSILLIDVRTREECARGRPAGSVNIPVFLAGAGGMTPNPAFVAEVEQVAPDRARRLVLSCAAGRRSMMAAEQLAAAGWQNLISLRGGWGGNDDDPGWLAAGLPVER